MLFHKFHFQTGQTSNDNCLSQAGPPSLTAHPLSVSQPAQNAGADVSSACLTADYLVMTLSVVLREVNNGLIKKGMWRRIIRNSMTQLYSVLFVFLHGVG